MWEDKEIYQALSLPEQGPLLIVTVGNELRGDDGVGPYIAGNLKTDHDRIHLYNTGFNPESSLDVTDQVRPGKVVFIDAANWDGVTGDLRVIPEDCIPTQTVSTHTFPLSTIGALVREDHPQCEICYLGIQLGSASLGAGMSPAVKKTADKLISYLQERYSTVK